MKYSINRTFLVFLFLLLLLLLDRTLFLLNFSFQYIDSDQMTFWQAANDYMKGIFHEPYFYGQNYNFMIEAFFAVPFLRLGIPLSYALPIVTSLLSLFPFIIFACVLYRKSYIIESFIFLAIPLTLPIEYEILTSISRGFVTGLFASGFLVFCLLRPQKKSSFAIFGSLSALSYILNPNSLVFIFPFGVYLWMKNYRTFHFYLLSLAASLPFLIIQFFSRQFYYYHPDYIIQSMWKLNYSFKTLITSFSHLDNFFSYLTPVIWIWGWLVILILIILGVFLFVKDKKKGLSVFAGVIFIIASLGINKVNDGMNTIFLSSARMFLGIPVLFGLSLVWAKEYLPVKDMYWKFSILLICSTLFFVKVSFYKPVIRQHTLYENFGPVAIKKAKQLQCECYAINNIAQKYNVDLIVFIPDWKRNVPYMEFYNYGCPLLEKNFTRTLMNSYERRTWVYHQERNAIRRNILLYGYVDMDLLHQIDDKNIISIDPETNVVKNNTLQTKTLLKLLNISLKQNDYQKFNDYY